MNPRLTPRAPAWLLALAISLALAAALEAAPALRTYHVAVRKDGRHGTGTAQDPFDGGTSARFDALMASFRGVPNLHFIFGPGTYHTSSGIGMDNNWIIEGAGPGATTFKWNDGTFSHPTETPSWMFYTTGATDGSGAYAFCTNQSFAVLRDFTIDNNLDRQPIVTARAKGYVMAYNLVGMYLTVERLRVKGTYSRPGEQFPCALGVPYTIGSRSGQTSSALRPRFLTRHVVVTDCRGTSQSVVSHMNWSDLKPPFADIWLDSRMEDCEVRGGLVGVIAFGGGGWSSHRLQRCRAYDVEAFAVWDTGKIHDTIVENCVGRDIGTGRKGNVLTIGGAPDQVRGLVIRNNRFSLGRGGGQICIISSKDMTDTVFSGNWADGSGSVAAGQYFVAFNCLAPAGQFVNNTFDPTERINSKKILQGWTIRGNKLTNGRPLPDLGRPSGQSSR